MIHNQQLYILSEEFVKNLIQEGNIDRDFGGKTLARICVDNGKLDLLQLLINAGSKPNFLIRSAVRAHQYKILQYLIDQNFDVNETTETTASALYAAVMENLPDYGKLLLDNGADPTVTFKDQALLSYAAKNVSPSFFKMLIENGAPISALQPAIPPLITALKKQQMNIVATLLSLGADPDASCQSRDSHTYPLDVAFRNKSSSAMTMLLMTGARKNNIPLDDLDDEMRRQFEEYNQPPSIKEPQLVRDLQLLFGQFRPLESTIKTLSAEIMKIHDPREHLFDHTEKDVNNKDYISVLSSSPRGYAPSTAGFSIAPTQTGKSTAAYSTTYTTTNDIPTLQITPYIQRIRDAYEKLCDFMPKILKLSETIDSKRLPILRKQFLIFEQDDKKKLTPVIMDDNDKWRSLFSRTIELMSRNKSRGALQENAFIDYCNTELRKRAEQFADQQSSVICFTDEVAITDQKEMMENRETLAFFVDLLQNFKQLLKMINDSLILLQHSSQRFFSLATYRVEKEMERLERLSVSEQLLARCGLPYSMITEVRDSVRPKQDLVTQTQVILESNKSMCENCSKLLMKCVRQCVK